MPSLSTLRYFSSLSLLALRALSLARLFFSPSSIVLPKMYIDLEQSLERVEPDLVSLEQMKFRLLRFRPSIGRRRVFCFLFSTSSTSSTSTTNSASSSRPSPRPAPTSPSSSERPQPRRRGQQMTAAILRSQLTLPQTNSSSTACALPAPPSSPPSLRKKTPPSASLEAARIPWPTTLSMGPRWPGRAGLSVPSSESGKGKGWSEGEATSRLRRATPSSALARRSSSLRVMSADKEKEKEKDLPR